MSYRPGRTTATVNPNRHGQHGFKPQKKQTSTGFDFFAIPPRSCRNASFEVSNRRYLPSVRHLSRRHGEQPRITVPCTLVAIRGYSDLSKCGKWEPVESGYRCARTSAACIRVQ